MKYNVHIYATVCVKVIDVEAESQTEAIGIAQQSVDLFEILEREKPAQNVQHVEFVEEVSGFLVDEEGDEEFEKSNIYEADGETPYDWERCPLCGQPKHNALENPKKK